MSKSLLTVFLLCTLALGTHQCKYHTLLTPSPPHPWSLVMDGVTYFIHGRCIYSICILRDLMTTFGH